MAETNPLITSERYSGSTINELAEQLRRASREESRIRKFIAMFNNEDYWPVWIGFVWYGVVVGLTQWGLDIARIKPWSGRNLVDSFTPDNIAGFLLIFAATLITLYIVHRALGRKEAFGQYILICLLVIAAKIIGNNIALKHAGIGDSVWCIIFGFVFGNIFKNLRSHFKAAFSLEFFIKIGIVLLAVDMREIAVSGAKGLAVAWAETCIIIVGIYILGVKLLQMDPVHAIVTSCGVCICGSSAAMAVKDVVRADPDMIISLITIMSILTVPLIPILPLLSSLAHFNVDTTGAWIGGSIDSTGAVSATASLSGLDVLHAAIIIKMLQNILIGPVVLALTAYWNKAYRIGILWEKFPKFVLGFVIVGIITTVLPHGIENRVIDNSFVVSEWFSSISFILIGIDIDIYSLREKVAEYKKVMLLYVIGQTIDLGTTLGVSYLMFTIIK